MPRKFGDVISEVATPNSAMANRLRGTVSLGAWKRLIATACEEMRQLTFTMGAGFEADEPETIKHCAYAVKGLALNFGANDIANLARVICETQDVEILSLLLAEISLWQKAQ